MVVSIATANVAPVFAAEPAGTVKTQKETRGNSLIVSGKIKFRDTKMKIVSLCLLKMKKLSWKEHKYDVMPKETVEKYLPGSDMN